MKNDDIIIQAVTHTKEKMLSNGSKETAFVIWEYHQFPREVSLPKSIRLERNIARVPIKSAAKPIIHTLNMTVFTLFFILGIFRYFIVSTSANKSMTKFAGSTTIHVMGNTHNNHIGNIILYNFSLFLLIAVSVILGPAAGFT